MEKNTDFFDRAVRLHRENVLLDAHIDTTQRLRDPAFDFEARHDDGHVDLPRLREAGVDGAFFAVWSPGVKSPGEGVREVHHQLDMIEKLAGSAPEALCLARTADEVRAAASTGRLAVVPALEGGYLIEDSLDHLRAFAARGVTYMTLTHGFHTNWADSAGIHEPLVPRHGGLTDFGREVVAEMNRLGVMVDVSHVSDDTVRDVLGCAAAPVIASHSSCRAVSDHVRNLPDDLIRDIAGTGGVVQINFAAGFVDPDFPTIDPARLAAWMGRGDLRPEPLTDHVTPLRVLVDHFEHALRLVGPNHVGIGTDFDGVPQLPDEVPDCTGLLKVTTELLRRGFSEAELAPVLGANLLRVMDACRAAAA